MPHLELVNQAGLTLYRLFRHPGGDWEPPPEQFRILRADPPAGHKGDYAVLYTSDALAAAAMECRVLYCENATDRWCWHEAKAATYSVARYTFDRPAVFLPLDGQNRKTLGLSHKRRYSAFQDIAHTLFQRYGGSVDGLSWESFHRGQIGRVYAIWHSRKASLGLNRTTTTFPLLTNDTEWLGYLAANPDIETL